ncbi:ABC transporter permease [Thalassotalea insulae]|uniref:ABC transporter permease n=1 Tax=Thalassotalea insulae TaxID=2056778 RepID=A0ABQ6GXL1_9GAMM|nr:FtsX-like permease family protein [Thalassotalea insulae]GLX79490.1 ABC transporter permease [Thalassotalea insulae]
MLNISPIFNAMMRNKNSIVLIIMQIALTLAIVSNAAFIIEQRISDMQRDTGIKEAQVLSFNLYFFDPEVEITDQLLLDEQELRKLPGVIDAVAINQIPLSGSGDSWSFLNQAQEDGALQVGAGVFHGGEHLLSGLGVAVSRGRNFTANDVVYLRDGMVTPDAAIVTQAFADTMFANEDALGKTIYNLGKPIEIIGIVDQMQGSWLHSDNVENNVFVPMIMPSNFKRFAVHVEAGMANEIRHQIEDIMLKLENRRVIMPVASLEEQKKSSYQQDRLMTNMLMVIIAVLIFITALGIAGMTIFNVNRRQKQIGTRRALGASRLEIQRYFMIESALIAGIGIVIGIILALVLNNYLMTYFSSESLSFDYIVATLTGIILVIEFAVFWPARKASMISPAIATRSV